MVEPKQRPDTGASYRQCLRELKWMVVAWSVAFVWVVGYVAFNGYGGGEEGPVRLVFGIPSWVFYGWLLPLLAANGFTLWFCMRFMRDEPMEALPEEELVPDDDE